MGKKRSVGPSVEQVFFSLALSWDYQTKNFQNETTKIITLERIEK